MEVYTLIRLHEKYQPSSCFFSRNTLRFFGERINEMRVLKGTVKINGHECWVLSTRQRKAPAGVSQRRYHYFDIITDDAGHIESGKYIWHAQGEGFMEVELTLDELALFEEEV